MKRVLAVIIAIFALFCAVTPTFAAESDTDDVGRAMAYSVREKYMVIVPEGIEMTSDTAATAEIKAQSVQITWGTKLVISVESQYYHNLQSKDETKLVPYTIQRQGTDIVMSSAGGFALEIVSGEASVTENLDFFVGDVGGNGLFQDMLTFKVGIVDQ